MNPFQLRENIFDVFILGKISFLSLWDYENLTMKCENLSCRWLSIKRRRISVINFWEVMCVIKQWERIRLGKAPSDESFAPQQQILIFHPRLALRDFLVAGENVCKTLFPLFSLHAICSNCFDAVSVEWMKTFVGVERSKNFAPPMDMHAPSRII